MHHDLDGSGLAAAGIAEQYRPADLLAELPERDRAWWKLRAPVDLNDSWRHIQVGNGNPAAVLEVWRFKHPVIFDDMLPVPSQETGLGAAWYRGPVMPLDTPPRTDSPDSRPIPAIRQTDPPPRRGLFDRHRNGAIRRDISRAMLHDFLKEPCRSNHCQHPRRAGQRVFDRAGLQKAECQIYRRSSCPVIIVVDLTGMHGQPEPDPFQIRMRVVMPAQRAN